MNSILIRGITEMVTFRINKRFKKEITNYEDMSNQVTNGLTRMTMIHEFFFGAFALLVAIIKVIILILFFKGYITVTLGGLVALITYVDRIYNPVAIFNVIFVQYHLDLVSYKRVKDFYDLPDDNQLFIESGHLSKINSITLKNVDLNIENKNILKNVNMKFDTNKIYGLIGESGSGKSTLIKIILGLFKPLNGEIFFNDRKLSQLNLNDVYNHVFYLSQDVPIFKGSLRKNIVFDKKIPDKQIIEILVKCQLTSFYDNLPKGLDSQIGEKGANLSGGEKQRIAFARMFFSNAEVIIIDEATSALDETTEEKIFEEISNLLVNKLVIMITHRPKNLIFADEVINLNAMRE